MTTPLVLTPARRVTLALGVPLAVAAIGWAGLFAVGLVGQDSYPIRFSAPARGGQVSVWVGAGQVSLRAGASGRVVVSGTARYSLIRSSATWRSTASGVTIDTSCHAFAVPCTFDYDIAVPADSRARVTEDAGHLSASGLSGPVTLADGSGSIKASGLSGEVRITDESGDISATALSGPDVRIQNQSGDISVTSLASGLVTVLEGSGNVTLAFAVVPQRVVITDHSGSITVILPPGSTQYQVHASTTSGATVIGVPTSPASPYVIDAASQSGDVTIVR
jgi:Putative adhesin